MKTKKDISIVIPVYRGAQTISELFSRLHAVLTKENKSFEVIFVDDNSPDESWSVICQLKEKFPDQIRGISLSKNYGQHGATFCGIQEANADLLVTMDDDLEHAPEDISVLLDFYKKNDVDLVYGSFEKQAYSFFRKLTTNTFRFFQKIEGSEKGKGSSFRLMNKMLYESISKTAHGFVFIDEVCLWYTDRLGFVSVELHPSRKPKSNYSFLNLFMLSMNLIVFSTNKPLRIMSTFGLLSSIFFGLFFIRVILKKWVSGAPLGYTSIMASILLSTSLILFCLGIVGEYLNRVYKMQKREPLYNVRKII